MDLGTVGPVGVGGLGLAMAERLIDAGHSVIGYRRSAMDDLVAAGGIAATSGREVAARADIVLVCLPGADALEDVMTRDDGLGAGLRDGHVVVEMSTTPVAAKRRQMARAAEQGAVMLDCPLSGTPGMMRAGRASIFASGDQAAAEALAFAVREGADPKAIHDTIKGSVAASGMFELRGKMMAERDYGEGGSLRGFLRSLEIVAAEAEAVGAATPLLSKTVETSFAAIDNGFNEPDQAIVFEYLLDKAEGPKK